MPTSGLPRTFIQHADYYSPAINNASNAQLGAWLRLCIFCDATENYGRIKDAFRLEAGALERIMRDDAAMLKSLIARGMAKKEGADLVVIGYDVRSSQEFRKQKDAGHRTQEMLRLKKEIAAAEEYQRVLKQAAQVPGLLPPELPSLAEPSNAKLSPAGLSTAWDGLDKLGDARRSEAYLPPALDPAADPPAEDPDENQF